MYYPVKLQPEFKDYLWGGDKLKKVFHKKCDFDCVAESWELSTHEDGLSRIEDDNVQEKTLKEYIASSKGDILGTKVENKEDLPILVKFIDAKQSLSIQVHPDDAYAKKYEGDNGKTEMWYIVDCEPDAFLYFGVKETMTKEEAQKSIQEGNFEEKLQKVPVKKGDVFFIPAGTIHAIGKGNLICEIQQSSNVTYRLYDYNRKDKFGNLRELHIESGLKVANLEKQKVDVNPEEVLLKTDDTSISLLKSCRYFNTFSYVIQDKVRISTSSSTFSAIIVLDGDATVESTDYRTELKKGETLFLPAENQSYEVKGRCEFLFVTA